MGITLYDVLRRPLITEKSNFQSTVLRQYVFEVNVIKVRTMLMPAKRARRQKRMTIRSSQYKKAIVTLSEGDTIDVFEGVK